MKEQLSLNLFSENVCGKMRTLVSSEIVVYQPTDELLQFCEKHFKVKNERYQFLVRNNKTKYAIFKGIPQYNYCYTYDREMETLHLPFGTLHAIWRFIKDYPYELIFNKTDDISIVNVDAPQKLYDYQEEAVSKMLKAKGGVLVSPCGSGKTRMGIEIVHRIGKKFLWLTHTKDLLEQTYNAFKSLYPDLKLGKISAGKDKEFGEDGTIAMVQSLTTLESDTYKDMFEVVVADECAHVVGTTKDASSFAKILNAVPARYKYGLTATPSRSDDKIKTMYMHLGVNLQGQFDATYFVPKSVVKTRPAQTMRIDLDTKFNESDFTKKFKNGKKGTLDYVKLVSILSDDESRTDEIVENILSCALEKRKQIVLCLRVEHLKVFKDKLIEKGIKAEAIHADKSIKERKELLSKDSDWQVLCATYNLLKEGNDIPALDTLHLAVPLMSKSTIIQAVGRIERFCATKQNPIVYDYVDKNLKYLEIAYFRRQKALKEGYE